MRVSLVINCDNRSQNNVAEKMFEGVVNDDFLTEGLVNKIKFFDGFDKEVIVYLDQHNDLQEQIVKALHAFSHTLVIRRHTHEISFNDKNYLRALKMADGDIVCHMDQDTAAFTASKDYVQEMIDLLEHNRFVSYPSYWSPRAVDDPSFGKRTWASTRFFICKREALKFDELEKCIAEPEWGYEKYGDSPRRCNWLEHFLTLTNEDSCYYPPIELDKGAIFSWGRYTQGTLGMLNQMGYDQVRGWIDNHPIHYPNDVDA